MVGTKPGKPQARAAARTRGRAQPGPSLPGRVILSRAQLDERATVRYTVTQLRFTSFVKLLSIKQNRDSAVLKQQRCSMNMRPSSGRAASRPSSGRVSAGRSPHQAPAAAAGQQRGSSSAAARKPQNSKAQSHGSKLVRVAKVETKV